MTTKNWKLDRLLRVADAIDELRVEVISAERRVDDRHEDLETARSELAATRCTLAAAEEKYTTIYAHLAEKLDKG